MVNRVTIKPDGPLIFSGELRLENAQGDLLSRDTEMFLCRCGHSGNKPYCDGAHKKTGFRDAAEIHDEKQEAPAGEDGLVITIRENAMLLARGPMLISNPDGSSGTTRNKAAFCRCGHSSNKPFCDASHKLCGFSG